MDKFNFTAHVEFSTQDKLASLRLAILDSLVHQLYDNVETVWETNKYKTNIGMTIKFDNESDWLQYCLSYGDLLTQSRSPLLLIV